MIGMIITPRYGLGSQIYIIIDVKNDEYYLKFIDLSAKYQICGTINQEFLNKYMKLLGRSRLLPLLWNEYVNNK